MTSPLNLARGVRQGDPLSFFLFRLAVEPLVSYINGSVHKVHNSTLPNYLKTFYYKLVKNVLPFQNKFCEFSLVNSKAFCVFYNKGPDSAYYVFKSREKLIMTWQFVDSLIQKTTIFTAPIAQTQLSLIYSIPTFLSQQD